jgi:uncharacterized membrane protein
MADGSISLSAANWLVPLAAAVALGVVVLFWGLRGVRTGAAGWGSVLLKLVALVALAFCLAEPLWNGSRARPGANVIAVVADNSQGLQIHDAGRATSRGEDLRNLLDRGRVGWLGALGEGFEVRRYVFDSRLQSSRDFSDLDFQGRSSAMVTALQSLTERYKGHPLAGILLLTDGNATDLRGQLPSWKGMPPVYPVVLGDAARLKDVSIRQMTTERSAFEDAPVVVQARVESHGFGATPLVARLTDQSGKAIQEQSLSAPADGGSAPLRFQIKPTAAGVSFFELGVRTLAESGAGAASTNSAEATLANNSRIVMADRGRGPHRILYVSGRPNWEFKFLNRALQEDDQLKLTGLIRVAKREPKFEFRGRAGETGNPLFRGFGDQSREGAERYDQPVLTPINPRDPLELRSGFPRTAEELYPFSAVIVDDLEAGFFSADQAALLQRFVSERGGGFLMLGGMESFQQGEYRRTPIGDMLPVYLDRMEEAKSSGPMRFALGREGWLLPWARIRDNESDERSRLEAMPRFEVVNRVGDAKPGASVVATVADESGQEVPALVVQRFGLGRTAALTVGDVWRWGMKDAASHADMDKGWRQLVRWLVAETPNRVDIAAEPVAGDPNGAMRLQVRARDASYLPLDNAAVTLEVEPIVFRGGRTTTNQASILRLQVEPSGTEPGVYEAVYVPRQTAGYRARVTVLDSAHAEVGRAETGWTSDLAAEEFASLVPNRGLLEQIATATGGEVVAASKLDDWVKHLAARPAPVMEPWSRPLWNLPALFALALICLVAEWGLRRWKGLP